ncbi:MAG: uracil-DNA glycosylase family protein [Candidatus Aenigmatarchaeota archaeon]
MVFPSIWNVKGFFGTGKVFFVCEQPSTGTFPTGADKLFYGLIEKYKFEEAHITDFIKCKGKVDKIRNVEIENCFPFLKEEIKILKPKIIVAVGKKVYEELKNRKIEGITFKKIMHYSYAYRYKKEKILENQFDELAKEIN